MSFINALLLLMLNIFDFIVAVRMFSLFPNGFNPSLEVEKFDYHLHKI